MLYSFQLQDLKGPALIFIVTTSLNWEWVSYAPAAFLRCGSHLSGSLSGTEPRFPVTRQSHGQPLANRRELIRQIFDRRVVGTRPYDPHYVIVIHRITTAARAIIGFQPIKAPRLTREPGLGLGCMY